MELMKNLKFREFIEHFNTLMQDTRSLSEDKRALWIDQIGKLVASTLQTE